MYTHMHIYIYISSCYILQVGVLDVDICGPSIPKVMGLEGEQVSNDYQLFLLSLSKHLLTMDHKLGEVPSSNPSDGY